MVELSKDARKAYRVFSFLREKLPCADVCTLRHISVYIARTNNEFDINRDLQLKLSDDELVCVLLLANGSVIRFATISDAPLDFIVEKAESNVCMKMIVSKNERYNLSTAYVYGDVVSGDWEYLVGSDEYEDDNCFIRVYYKGQLATTSYFKVATEDDISLDCIDGLGHLTSIMTRVELLYNNLNSVKNNRLVRKK